MLYGAIFAGVIYGYRYYSASLGRWINRDPIDELGHLCIEGSSEPLIWSIDEESQNLYRFAFNNPLGNVDALGESVSSYSFCVLSCYVGLKTYEVKALFNWDSLNHMQRKAFMKEQEAILKKMSKEKLAKKAEQELGVKVTGKMNRNIRRQLMRQLAKKQFSKKAWGFLMKKIGPKVSAKVATALAPNVVPGVGTVASVVVSSVLLVGDTYTVCKCGYLCSTGAWQ